jgi:hypothetical protein
VLSSVAADGGGIPFFDEQVDVVGSNFAHRRSRLLNGTTFAELGAACAAGIGFSIVTVRGRLPMKMSLSRPEELGSASYQEQNGTLPVRMTLAAPALNYDMDHVRSFFPPASCCPAI